MYVSQGGKLISSEVGTIEKFSIYCVTDVYSRIPISDLIGHGTEVEGKQCGSKDASLLQASCNWERKELERAFLAMIWPEIPSCRTCMSFIKWSRKLKCFKVAHIAGLDMSLKAFSKFTEEENRRLYLLSCLRMERGE